MVLEVAEMHIQPGMVDAFLKALPAGVDVLRQAKGFQGIEVYRGEERPEVVLLTLHWQTLEDHTVGFREGPLFPQWRAVISPFFASPPVVTHWHPTSD